MKALILSLLICQSLLAVVPINQVSDSVRQVPGAVGWWQAGDSLLNGAGVSTLYDRTGLGRVLTNATAAKQPTFTNSGTGLLNGYPTIYFDGVDDFLKSAAFTLNQPTFVVMVAKQVTSAVGDRLFDGDVNDSCSLRQADANGTLTLCAQDATYVASNNTLPLSSFGIIQAALNGASSFLRINRLAETTGNPGANNPGGFTLGKRGGSTGYANIQVAELPIYNLIPGSDRQDYLVRILARKYGLSL